MSGNLRITPLVIQGSLKATVNSADRQPVRLVEMRHRFVVLPFAVLDNKPETGPVAIHRQSPPDAVPAGIAEEPIEAVLSERPVTENLVAQVEDVVLITVGTAHLLKNDRPPTIGAADGRAARASQPREAHPLRLADCRRGYRRLRGSGSDEPAPTGRVNLPPLRS